MASVLQLQLQVCFASPDSWLCCVQDSYPHVFVIPCLVCQLSGMAAIIAYVLLLQQIVDKGLLHDHWMCYTKLNYAAGQFF